LEKTINERSLINPSSRRRLERFTHPDGKISFIDFIASLDNPPFNLIKQSELNEPQKQRYLKIIKEFCETNMYSYPSIQDSTVRDLCMEIHQRKIQDRLQKIQSLNANPKDIGWTHFDLFTIYEEKREFGKALEHLERALEYLPDNFHILINDAYTNQDMKNYPKAVAMFQRLLNLYPNTPEVFKDISRCYLGMNDLSSAKTFIEKAFQQTSINKKAADTGLIIYLRLKEWAKALPLAQKMIQSDPEGSLYIFRSVATALAHDGQSQYARHFIDKGLAMFPNDQVLVSLQGKMATKE
jgi:tetratricopeptide (TPR) repeat protein